MIFYQCICGCAFFPSLFPEKIKPKHKYRSIVTQTSTKTKAINKVKPINPQEDKRKTL